MINPRDQARRCREHLDAAKAIAGSTSRGLTTAQRRDVEGHLNAARAHLTSLEIATGLRPIGAALEAGNEAARG